MPRTRGLIRPTTRSEAVARAFVNLTALPSPPPGAPAGTLPQPIGYSLDPGQNGGGDPHAPHCGSPNYGNRVWTADCFGLVAYSLGFDRALAGPDGKMGTPDDYQGSTGAYLNCASAIDDAERKQEYFSPVDLKDAIPGDVLITREHIEIIVRALSGVSAIMTVGCSPRFDGTRKAAIGVGHPWSSRCRALRYRHFVVKS